MLVGFFKKQEERDCACEIVYFADRIWLREDEDGLFFRKFLVRLSEQSPRPLSEIRMAVPSTELINLESWNHTAFLEPEQFYFNSPSIRTTGKYRILQRPTGSDKHCEVGLIADQGLDNIKVYLGDGAVPRHQQVGDCRVVAFRFPTALLPGDLAESRVFFTIPNVSKNLGPSEDFPTHNVELHYLCAAKHGAACEILGKDNFVPVRPTLGGQNHSGGFSVLLYTPENFIRVTGFQNSEERLDFRDHTGNTTGPRTKFVFQLRRLVQAEGGNEQEAIGPDREFVISGTITPRDTGQRIRQIINGVKKIPDEFDTLRKEVSGDIEKARESITGVQDGLEETKKEVRWATYVAVAALVLSVLAFIPVVPDLLRLIRAWFQR